MEKATEITPASFSMHDKSQIIKKRNSWRVITAYVFKGYGIKRKDGEK